MLSGGIQSLRPDLVLLRRSAALAAIALVGCGQPNWRNPATSKGTAAVSPIVLSRIADAEAVRKPVAAARFTTLDPLPPPPEWAAPLMTRAVGKVFPKMGICAGNTDGVKVRYAGQVRGVRLAGWGWDPARKEPIPRVVLMGPDGRITGAGEGGSRRLDVPRVRHDIPSETTGWEALTWRYAGPVDVYGVLADGQTICRLGHIEL
jgi:hypothetical protein